jgi:hypothetical protein
MRSWRRKKDVIRKLELGSKEGLRRELLDSEGLSLDSFMQLLININYSGVDNSLLQNRLTGNLYRRGGDSSDTPMVGLPISSHELRNVLWMSKRMRCDR